MKCPVCKVNEAKDQGRIWHHRRHCYEGGPCSPGCGRALSIIEAVEDLTEKLDYLFRQVPPANMELVVKLPA